MRNVPAEKLLAECRKAIKKAEQDIAQVINMGRAALDDYINANCTLHGLMVAEQWLLQLCPE